MTRDEGTAAVVATLGDRAKATRAGLFGSRADTGHPGLYAWWVDDEGAHVLSATLGEPVVGLIYGGQAGATSSKLAKESAATLYSRIKGQHIGGNARSSTFRMTLTALLRRPLRLELMQPRKLSPPSNELLTDWIREHLSVVTVACPDRATLRSLEQSVLHELDPPLNLEGMDPSAVRTTLTALRREIAAGPEDGSSLPPVTG